MENNIYHGKKILLVEDEETLAAGLEYNLKEEGYLIDWAKDGKQALEQFYSNEYDLIILDIMLPYFNGFEIAEKVRAKSPQMPILMLTARTSFEDKVRGLELGADDYMTKPFSEAELLARLRVLRRCIPSEFEKPVLVEGDLKVDVTNHLFTLSGRKIDLTPIEGALLRALAAYAGMVVTCQWLLRSVWGAEGEKQWQYLRVFISSLRKKLKWTQGRIAIETLDNLGYRLWLRSGDRVHGEVKFPRATTELQNGEPLNIWRMHSRA